MAALRQSHRSHRRGPLTGSFDWTDRSIVLDVPAAAGTIVYGALLVGAGTLRVRGIRLEIARPDAERTDYPRRPSNLDFGGATA